MRAKTVVLGVRGTDFLMSQAGKKKAAATDIHTLQGVVEVARDEKTLLEGKGIEVPKNSMLSADLHRLEPPKPFDPSDLEKALADIQPDFSTFVKNDPEALRAASDDFASRPEIQDYQLRQQQEERLREQEAKQKAQAEEAQRQPSPPRWKGLLFQVNPVVLWQLGRGHVTSFQFSWSPYFRLGSIFGWRGAFGFYDVKVPAEKLVFTVLEFGNHLVVSLFDGEILLEPGMVFYRWGWGKRGNNAIMPVGQVSWRLSQQGVLERAFLAVSLYDEMHGFRAEGPRASMALIDRAVRIIKLGVGLRF